ncbi:hypothetical protein MHU86_8132 [Fragilaria crotonensis]|nr:hypothetical protein MHU86_8132 [Fragilaria crotonensis]
MPFNADEEEAYQTPRRSTPFRARQRSEYPAHTTPLHQLRSLVDDDRNDDASVIEEPKVLFEQVYVLTRQVNKGGYRTCGSAFTKRQDYALLQRLLTSEICPKDEDLVYQEVSMLSQIRDGPSSISGLVEFFDEDTRFYIVLDFAEGGDLLTTLVQKQKLNEMEGKLLAKSLWTVWSIFTKERSAIEILNLRILF